MAGVEDPFDRAFRELEAHWGEDAAHKRFIAFCSAQGALAEAGRRYREVRERDPARREEAARRIDEVLAAALATMQVLRTERKSAPVKPLNWLVIGMCACLILYVAVTVLRAR